MKEKIEKWLETPDRSHEEGYQLLVETKRVRNLPSLVRMQRPNEYNRNKVEYLLRQALNAVQSEAITEPNLELVKKQQKQEEKKTQLVEDEIESGIKKLQRLTPAQYEAAPEDVKALEKSWKKKYGQKVFMQGELNKLSTDEERKAHSDTILELSEQIQSELAAINYYLEHGMLPEAQEASTVVAGEVELIKAIKSVGDKISRLKKKIADGKAKPGDTDKLTELEKDIAALRQKQTDLKATA